MSVVCDGRVPVKVKGKIHKAVVRLILMFELEAALLKKMSVAEMKMLRWRARNRNVWRSLIPTSISKREMLGRKKTAEKFVSWLIKV